MPGVWYPVGGFQRVVAAFHRVAEEHGATFRFNTGVRKILLGPKGARGVELDSGEELEADVVVSNVDLVHTYNSLLPPDSYAKRLQNKDQTCSSISFYWGMKEIVPELGGHNVRLVRGWSASYADAAHRSSSPRLIASHSTRSSATVCCPPSHPSTCVLCPALSCCSH
jgi:phytoene desaturase (3,4-didehydrolycopene-forming)